MEKEGDISLVRYPANLGGAHIMRERTVMIYFYSFTFYFVDLNTKANKSHSKVLNLVSLFRDRQDVYCEIVGFKLGTLIVKTINLFPLDAHSTFSCDICLLLL